MSLKEKAFKGTVWSAIDSIAQKGCLFIIQIILARLLLPSEFGIIAMVIVFVTLSRTVVDAGFGKALVQRDEINDKVLSTVFYFNLSASIAMAFCLYYASPFISHFYELEQLTIVLRVLSLDLILGALGTVHQAVLWREFRFKNMALATIPAIVLSGILAIILAYLDYGVWALVIQILAQRGIQTLLLWWQARWIPKWEFSMSILKEMFPYGSRLALSGILDQGFQNIYVLVIGKIYAPVEVGYFQRARSFERLPILTLINILNRVAFPLFSSIKNDPIRMKSGMKKAVRFSCFLAIPGMALLAAISEPLIIALIGKKWLPCVPYLQWLCLVGALYPLHSINLNLLAAIGRTDLFLRLEIIKKVFTALNILITYRFGVQTMIYGMCITSSLALFINTLYTSKFINYSIVEQVYDIVPIIAFASVIFVSNTFILNILDLSSINLIAISLFTSIALAICGVRFMGPSVKDDIGEVLSRLPSGERIKKVLL